jgi:hypothetical protein
VNKKRWALALTLVALLVPLAAQAASAAPGPSAQLTLKGHRVFMSEAKESRDLSSVTLPAYRGTSGGQTVWFVVTDASSKKWADKYGANYVPKLKQALRLPQALMQVDPPGKGQGFDFPFTPTFGLGRFIDANRGGGCAGLPAGVPPPFLPIGPGCFHPSADGSYGKTGGEGFTPGVGIHGGEATGLNSYSPLITFTTPDGEQVVLNAPQIANASGMADKVLNLNTGADTVTYVETAGLYDDHTIHYASFDSGDPLAATIEDMTYAPAMAWVFWDTPNDNIFGDTSARAGIIAFTNGQTGLGNPERQGLNSIILDGATAGPNVIQFTPDDTDANGINTYSPMWDVHLATWADPSNAERIGTYEKVEQRSNLPVGFPTGDGPLCAVANDCPPDGMPTGEITAPFFNSRGLNTFGRSGFDVNCPIISTDAAGVVIVPPPS